MKKERSISRFLRRASVCVIVPAAIVGAAAFDRWNDPMIVVVIALSAFWAFLDALESAMLLFISYVELHLPVALIGTDFAEEDLRKRDAWTAIPICTALLYLAYVAGATEWTIFVGCLGATDIILAVCVSVAQRKK